MGQTLAHISAPVKSIASWLLELGHLVSSCVSLVKLLNFPVLQFPHPQGDHKWPLPHMAFVRIKLIFSHKASRKCLTHKKHVGLSPKY